MPYTTHNCDSLIGGAIRSLDSHSVGDLATGDRAVCLVSGELLYFKYNSTGTATENVSTHPYVVRPDDYVDGGNWEEQVAADRASKTGAAWSKSIGSGGDYATWAAMIADMPDLIAHAVTVTIKAGTTLTETCDIKNKHGLTSDAAITVQAEKYFPTSGALPTADSATATTLRDAALATAALGNDYFNGCWVFIVDGTGTDNGFVLITDYIDATGDVVVASWPGTQPDNTSRYLIVGALINANGLNYGTDIQQNTVPISLLGIGIKTSSIAGFYSNRNFSLLASYCGAYGNVLTGVMPGGDISSRFNYGGIVNNNTANNANHAGVVCKDGVNTIVEYCGISDNNQYGIVVKDGQFAVIGANFGDSNGVWGTYAKNSGQANIWGSECSGSSGNHSNGAGDGSLAY